MTEKKTGQKSATAGRGGKLMLSGALILASGAYAWSQHAVPQVTQITARPAAPPEQVAALPPQAAPTSSAPPSPENNIAAPAPRTAEPRDRPVETQNVQSDAPAVPGAPPQGETPVAPIAEAPPQPEAPVTLASNAPPPAAPAQTSGRYANGDFTGRPADTAWGLVQVRVSVRGGAITAIDPIDYPAHRRRSVQINNYALPVLEREVIQAQSARVDIVSQATTTSIGYLQSLATALDQAKK